MNNLEYSTRKRFVVIDFWLSSLIILWRGSIYKIVWAELIVFLGIYYALNLSYVFAISENVKEYFRKIVTYCAGHSNFIPLSFVLGFFIDVVFKRWWSQFLAIPSPENLALLIGANIKGQDEYSKQIRKTIVRYVCVTFTMTLRIMSPKVKKRYLTLDHFVDARLLTHSEKEIIEDLDKKYPNNSKLYWLPLAWAANVTTGARLEGVIRDDSAVTSILDQISDFRSKCGKLLSYNWISVPLVYTQVVTIAVYSYFLITVIGNQFVEQKVDKINNFIFNFPLLSILEFFFYMGWLKVAETLINPFGEDDDDFEVVSMIDRNIQVCNLLVDKIHQAEHPPLIKDYYWQQTGPPVTVAPQQCMEEFLEINEQFENIQVEMTDDDLTTKGPPHWITSPCRTYEVKPMRKAKRTSMNLSFPSMLRSSKSREEHEDYKNVSRNFIDYRLEEIKEDEVPRKPPTKITKYPKTQCNENAEEFECLRQQRLQSQKEKLQNYIELAKTIQK